MGYPPVDPEMERRKERTLGWILAAMIVGTCLLLAFCRAP